MHKSYAWFGSRVLGVIAVAAVLVLASAFFVINQTHAEEVTDPATTDTTVVEPLQIVDQPTTDIPLEVVEQPTDEAPVVEVVVLDEVPPLPVVEESTVVQSPELTTDKADYFPGETATIWGKFFTALQNVILSIVGTNADGTEATSSSWDVTADDVGSFETYYELINSYVPLYMLAANSDTGEVLATTTFTDAPPDPSIGYDKGVYRNDQGKWTTGNAGDGYLEGDWVPYTYAVNGLGGAETSVPDFNVVYNHFQSSSNSIFIDAFAHFYYCWNCTALPDGQSFPNDFVGADAWTTWTPLNINYEYNDGAHTCTTVDAEANGPAEFHCFRVTEEFGGIPSGTDNTLRIFYLAHLSRSSDWLAGNEANLTSVINPPTSNGFPAGAVLGEDVYSLAPAWTGAYNGMGFASGSSRHFNLQDQSAGPNGAITLPIPTVPPPSGSITLDKVTVPSGDLTQFDFTTSNLPSPTAPSLADATTPVVWSNLGAGTYEITETVPGTWNLTSKDCTGGTNSVVSQIANGVSISLAGGENLVCTFTNTLQTAHIIVVKDAVPNDAQDFAFTNNFANGNPSPFSLDDDADGTLSDSRNSEVIAGKYSVSETVPAGWSQTSATCDQGETINDIDVAPGETVTCTFVNTKLTSSVVTELHMADESVVANNGHVDLGTSMHDKATVSANVGIPTGDVVFTFFNNIDCTGEGTGAGTVAVNGSGVAHPSTSQTSLAAGNYSFKAHYNGDGNYPASDSDCEPFIVDKAQLEVTTAVHNAAHVDKTNSNVPLGSVMHDTASVTGGVNGFALPAVTFTLTSSYTDSCANGAAVANNGTEGSAVKSADSAALGAGTYAYRAVVAGDDNYLGDTGVCEPFTVDKAQLTVTTTIHKADHTVVPNDGHVALGTVVHDNADVTGEVAGFPIPAISFTLNAAPVASAVSAEAGFDATSVDSAALAAGNYTYSATVAGDANYLTDTSDPEPFVVDKAQLIVTTAVHNAAHEDKTNSNVPLGSVMHDTATVTGSVAGFTVPSATFTLTSSYTDSCANGAAVANDGTEGGADKSADSAALGANSYAYRGSVAGNANYLGDDSDCEPFTVDKAQLTVTTEIHDANDGVVAATVALGSVLHDTAAVSGGVQGFTVPTPTFTLTSDYDDDCSDGVVVANNGTDAGNGNAKSADSSPLAAGSYSYRGSVAGNDNYLGDDSDCEPFTVNKKQLAITTTVHDSADVVISNNGHVALGTNTHDNADVTGEVAGFPIGAISFTFQGNPIANDSTEAPFDATSVASGALAAGNYTYNASVASNSNYIGATSDPEPFVVDKAQLTVTTTIHKAPHDVVPNNGHVDLGTVTHDNAEVTGEVGGFPIPAISFTLNAVAVANGSTDAGFDATSVDSSALAAGNYTYQATVAGDDNYLGDTSDEEPFVVDKAKLEVSTVVHDASDTDKTNGNVPLGSVMHDTATMTGVIQGFSAPTPTFTLTSSYTGTCAAGAAVANNGTEGLADKSADSAALGAGAYAYRAAVTGNDNYDGDTGECEPFTVDKAQLGITTKVHNAAHEDKTNAMVPLNSVMHDTATLTGAVNGFAVPTPSFTLTSNYTDSCAAGAAVANNGMENTDYKSADSAALGAGTYAYRAAVAGDANYLGATGVCEPFRVINPHTTISITPNTQETQAGSNVILTIVDTNDGDVPLTTPTVALAWTGGNSETLSTVASAHCTAATESGTVNGIMDVGESWTWTCTIMISVDTTFNVAGHGFDPLGNDISPQNGYTTEAGSTTVRVIGTTRTLGFWQTHTSFTTAVFALPGMQNYVGFSGAVTTSTHKGTITNSNPSQLFGGFYAPIAKTTTGVKRTPVDQARIQMLQQLLAAKLNCAAFGCSASITTLIAQADAAYLAGANKNSIIALAGQLDAFNNSGDSGAIPPSLPATGKATPQTSKSIADLVFWNTP